MRLEEERCVPAIDWGVVAKKTAKTRIVVERWVEVSPSSGQRLLFPEEQVSMLLAAVEMKEEQIP